MSFPYSVFRLVSWSPSFVFFFFQLVFMMKSFIFSFLFFMSLKLVSAEIVHEYYDPALDGSSLGSGSYFLSLLSWVRKNCVPCFFAILGFFSISWSGNTHTSSSSYYYYYYYYYYYSALYFSIFSWLPSTNYLIHSIDSQLFLFCLFDLLVIIFLASRLIGFNFVFTTQVSTSA